MNTEHEPLDLYDDESLPAEQQEALDEYCEQLTAGK